MVMMGRGEEEVELFMGFGELLVAQACFDWDLDAVCSAIAVGVYPRAGRMAYHLRYA
jgi:hypothetical protein